MSGFLRLVALLAAAAAIGAGAASAKVSADPPLTNAGSPLVFHNPGGAGTATFRVLNWLPRHQGGKTFLYAEVSLAVSCDACDKPQLATPQAIQLLLRNGTRINAVADSNPDVGLWDGAAFHPELPFAGSGGRVIFQMPKQPTNNRDGARAYKAWLKKFNGMRVKGLVITLGSESQAWAVSPAY